MTIFNELLIVFWVIFVAYWLVSALSAKKTVQRSNGVWFRIIFIIAFYLIMRTEAFQQFLINYFVFSSNSFVSTVGVILTGCGIALAIWARVYIGKNWGMPMSVQKNAELVTSGPYSLVRNPIYSGSLLAMFGSALVQGAWWFIVLICAGIYFIYSAKKEEKLMVQQFPNQYPAYKDKTKMLIPYIL